MTKKEQKKSDEKDVRHKAGIDMHIKMPSAVPNHRERNENRSSRHAA